MLRLVLASRMPAVCHRAVVEQLPGVLNQLNIYLQQQLAYEVAPKRVCRIIAGNRVR